MNGIRKIIYCICFIICFVNNLSAEEVFYRQYTTANSLISNTVYSIVRDADGYLWFLTDKGVSKFDGKNFFNYSVLDGLPDNEVFNAYEDSHRRLWFFAFNGVPCYIYQGKIHNPTNDIYLQKFPVIPYISGMAEDKDSHLYIVYNRGQTIKISHEHFEWINKEIRNDLLNTFYLHNNTVQLYMQHSFLSVRNGDIINERKIQSTYTSFQEGKLLVANSSGLKLYEKDSLLWRYQDYSLNKSIVTHLFWDNQGYIFCCTNKGLYIINIYSRCKLHLFADSKISWVEKDIYGNYWVGTAGKGVFKLNKYFYEIKLLKNNINSYNFYPLPNGPLVLTKNNNVFTLTGQKKIKLIKLSMTIKDNCQPLYMDKRLFCYYDPLKQRSYFYNKKTKVLNYIDFYAKYIFPEKNQKIFLFNPAGISFINTTDKKFVIKEIARFKSRILNVHYLNHEVYFTSGNVLYQIDLSTLQIHKQYSLAANQYFINSYRNKDKLDFILNNQTIIEYNLLNNQVNKVKAPLNLTIYKQYDLVSAKRLFSTSEGYYLSSSPHEINDSNNVKKLEFPFNQADYLFLYPYRNKMVCNINGSLYSFSQDLLNKQADTPCLFIKSIILNNKHYEQTQITQRNALSCHVVISLATLHFNNGENHIQYRISDNNITGEWQEQLSDRVNIIIGKYGSYNIEVRAVTENGILSAAKIITIHFLPPFYLTWSFFTLYLVIIILLIVYWLYRFNKRRKIRFQNELNHLKAEKEIVNSLMTPHFVFNAINNIQNLINTGSRESANEYLSTLSRLIRQNIENLQYAFIPLEDELKLIDNYIQLQNLRFANRIKLIIEDYTQNVDRINIPPLLIHTFVENSIVHGFKSSIKDFTIDIELSLSTDDYLIIKITDNGSGYSAEEKNNSLYPKTSLGINFTKKRLQRISALYKVNYSLEIKKTNEITGGTEVLIILYSKFAEKE